MRVAVATDHAGYVLKEDVIQAVERAGHQVLDLGTDRPESVDYPDFTYKLGRAIQEGKAERGILLCGSGVGVCIAANKMKGLYAAICHNTYLARQGVEHDGMNILCLGGRVIGPELVKDIVPAFLGAEFIGEQPGQGRHARRVGKVHELEREGALK
jgi:ribose 5-phosphate isomerase B